MDLSVLWRSEQKLQGVLYSYAGKELIEVIQQEIGRAPRLVFRNIRACALFARGQMARTQLNTHSFAPIDCHAVIHLRQGA